MGLNLFAWDNKDLVTSARAVPPCAYKSDSNASREWRSISGCSNSVPVESSFPSDLAIQCGHWDEQCMQNEIMTPTVQRRGPVSRVTIGALEDLGYAVDYSKADDFGTSDVAASCRCPGSSSRSLVRKVSESSERQLSSSGFDAAVAYGQELISQHQPRMRQESNVTDTEYVVGNAAVVLVYEDGELFSVTTSL